MDKVEGWVAPGFERVRDEFIQNFVEGTELGASFAAYRDGQLVADLWGGAADLETGQRWTRDSLQLMFSGTKGLIAGLILILVDEGRLSLDEPVEKYWPEFGKSNIRVSDVVSHQARLPGLSEEVTVDDILDPRGMSIRLARQAPTEDARATICYHPLSYGWLCAELIRRITGSTAGAFFAERIARPLELELWLGLPLEHERRATRLIKGPDWGSASYLSAQTWEVDGLIRSIWGNPDFLSDLDLWNSRRFHAAEIPGANAIGTARSMAAYYGCLAMGGSPLMSDSTLSLGLTPLVDGEDVIHGGTRRHGVGFMLQTEASIFGPPTDAFGHDGAGGSCHGGWPTQRVGFSYAMNRLLDNQQGNDQRAKRILRALYEAAR